LFAAAQGTREAAANKGTIENERRGHPPIWPDSAPPPNAPV
jgi:hypothetical protein